MVSAWFLGRAWVAVVLVVSVVAKEFPLLLDATAEELGKGLEAGDFSSVDLVNVRYDASKMWRVCR